MTRSYLSVSDLLGVSFRAVEFDWQDSLTLDNNFPVIPSHPVSQLSSRPLALDLGFVNVIALKFMRRQPGIVTGQDEIRSIIN
jgi:hypothetical protein